MKRCCQTRREQRRPPARVRSLLRRYASLAEAASRGSSLLRSYELGACRAVEGSVGMCAGWLARLHRAARATRLSSVSGLGHDFVVRATCQHLPG